MHRKVAWIVHQVTQQIEALSGKAGPALDRDRQHVRGIDEADGVFIGREVTSALKPIASPPMHLSIYGAIRRANRSVPPPGT